MTMCKRLLIFANSSRVATVSYTHLDVYKRQLFHTTKYFTSYSMCHEMRSKCLLFSKIYLTILCLSRQIEIVLKFLDLSNSPDVIRIMSTDRQVRL